MIWNLPNRITLSRLLLALALFVLLGLVQAGHAPRGWIGWTCFGLFVVAAATDWIDGWLARKLGMVSAFGRVMDPFVDKVVTGGSLVFLAALFPASIPAWIVVTILAREFFVHAIRGVFEARGVSFAAEMPGKIKMVMQCFAIGAMLLHMTIGEPLLREPRWLHWVVTASLWIALLSSVQSGWLYARKAWSVLASG